MAPANNVNCKQVKKKKKTHEALICEHSVNSNSHNNNIWQSWLCLPWKSRTTEKTTHIQRYWQKSTKAAGDEVTKHRELTLSRDANTKWLFQRQILNYAW